MAWCQPGESRRGKGKGEGENGEEGAGLYIQAQGGEVASEGSTEEPHGGKPLYRSSMFKCSKLAQKCLKNRLNAHFLASLSPKPSDEKLNQLHSVVELYEDYNSA